VGRIVNRRNALLGWAVLTFMRQRAKARAKADAEAKAKAKAGTEGQPRRWVRRVVRLLAAALAAVGALALWRKLHGGGEEEWTAPEPLDVESAPADSATPLTAVEPDNDVPPAA
jgi:hypothetical protein